MTSYKHDFSKVLNYLQEDMKRVKKHTHATWEFENSSLWRMMMFLEKSMILFIYLFLEEYGVVE
jgi:hypothetical protein